MATFTKVNDFVEDLGNKVHDLSNDTITVALSNTAPASETSDPSADGNGVLANVTEVSYTNCSSRAVTTTSWSVSSGTASLVLVDLTLTATGDVGPFQYVYLYNDTATNDELIGYYDYGTPLTLESGDSFLVDFGATTITLV